MATQIASHSGMFRRFPDKISVICFTESLHLIDIYSPSQYAPKPHSLASLVGSIGSTVIGHGMCRSIRDVHSSMMADFHHFISALLPAFKCTQYIVLGIDDAIDFSCIWATYNARLIRYIYDRPNLIGRVINSNLPINTSRSASDMDLPHASSSSAITFSRCFNAVPIVIVTVLSV